MKPHATSPVAPPPSPEPAVDPRIAALALIPHGHFVLTAAFGDYRGGVIVRWVQQVSSVPPLVIVAIEKGQPLSPLIRDSRRFALCQLPEGDRILLKIFEPDRDDPTDPFLGLATIKAPSGSPVPVRAAAWLDCELTRHLDVEGNCELYVGLVHAGSVLPPRLAPAPPADARTRPDAPRRR
ncbi:MAG: flavin reductase family protein [Phycisphaerales bacterium]